MRIPANENISTTTPVEVIELRRASLISDVDDTVKRSNISLGTREIFRNTLVRDLGDLTVDGVRERWQPHARHGRTGALLLQQPVAAVPVLAAFFTSPACPRGRST